MPVETVTVCVYNDAGNLISTEKFVAKAKKTERG
jgi:hypothetical protein